jgi:hypothetical protein
VENTGYKIVQENDEMTDDPRQLLVIDYNNKNFGEVLQGIVFVIEFVYFRISSSLFKVRIMI